MEINKEEIEIILGFVETIEEEYGDIIYPKERELIERLERERGK